MGSGAKGGGMGQTYNYYGTLAGAVCIGPAEDLIAIILNGQEVWPKGTTWVLGLTYDDTKLYVFDAQTWTCPVALNGVVATAANAPGTAGWTEYTFTRTTENYDDFSLTAGDGTYYGVMRFYWGTQAQTVDSLLASTGNDGGVKGNLGSGDQHPDYEGLVYVVVRDFLLGQDVQSGPNIEIVTRRKPNQSIITDAAAGIVDGQANLAAVAAELLTDENCLGLPATMVDATTFAAVADFLQTNQAMYNASVLIDASESITSIFDKLVQMFDGYIRFNPTTQKIELGVYQHGVVPGAYTTLTADSFTKFPKFSAASWQETVSRATVRYNSRQINYAQTSVQVDDPRAFFVLGTVREQSLDRPWIARLSQAMIHGRETLRVIGHAQMTGELEVRREIGRTIRAGDYVLVDIDLEPDTNSIYQFFRVTQRKIPPTGPITLSVFADNTLAPVPWNNPTTPVTLAVPSVPALTNWRVLEVPYALSQEVGAVIVLAQRPNNLIVGMAVYIDTNPSGTFSLLGNQNSFAAQATLHANVAAADTTLQLTVDTTQVDANYLTVEYSANDAINDTMLAILVSISGGQVAESGGYGTMEICSVSTQTLISAGQYNLTVLRGRKNTVPTAFATATTEVWLIPSSMLTFFTANIFDQIRANRLLGLTPNQLQFRFCPFTFVNQLPLASATSEPFQFPLNSASVPSLTLTAPGSFTQAFTSATLPVKMKVIGSWATQDNSLIKLQVLLRLSTDTADRSVVNQTFAPTGNKSFATIVQFDAAGVWTVKLIATDSTGVVVERDITVTVTSSGGVKCALPQLFDAAGSEVIDASGLPISGFNGWQVNPDLTVAYGVLKLICSTPGATLHFSTTGPSLKAGVLATVAGNQIFALGSLQPFFTPTAGAVGSTSTQVNNSMAVVAWATAPGYVNSDNITFNLPLFYLL